MTTIACLGRIIPARWFKFRVSRRLASLLLLASPLFPAIGARAAEAESLKELGLGIKAYSERDFDAAARHLRSAGNIPKLSDYVAYHLASSLQQATDYDSALAVLAAYRAGPVADSPLAGKIAWLYGRVLLDKREPAASAKALEILQSDYRHLPQPDGDFALGLAYEALGERQQAALTWEYVFYGFPNTELAAQASLALDRLRTALGTDFPAAPPLLQLERSEQWLAAKEYSRARQEYSALAASLNGAEQDRAKTGVGAAQYLAGDSAAAFRYLKTLSLADPEAEAERLYYLTEAARKTGDDSSMLDAVKDLGARFPQSPWRLKALMAAGNRYVQAGDPEGYGPLFSAVAEAFSSDSAASQAHWKLAWDAWMADKPDRITFLRDQLRRYPGDTHASGALYFLGRAAENDQRFGEARAYYDRLIAAFPHYFYAVLARQKAGDARISAVPADAGAKAWLDAIAWPARRDFSTTEPNPATRLRIERARLLLDATLPDLSEAELRFGAGNDLEQRHLLALELARTAPSPFRSLRAMKSLAGDYLSLPFDSASVAFWRGLFPLPYKDALFGNAESHGLDPFYVAGLIRQESEFNPGAKSRSNAYGLMQLIPATGRLMGRKEGINLARTSMLLDPAVNIRLGTQYLSGQLANWNGDWSQTLAAYNAGPGRVRRWLMDASYREPAEFIESIPFNETREYVQAVLRNAEIYRELYTGKLARQAEASATAKPVAAKPVVAKKAAVPASVQARRPAPAPASGRAATAVAAP